MRIQGIDVAHFVATRSGVVADRGGGTGMDDHLIVVNGVGSLSPCQNSVADTNHSLSNTITTE